jgi:hypothetical protein
VLRLSQAPAAQPDDLGLLLRRLGIEHHAETLRGHDLDLDALAVMEQREPNFEAVLAQHGLTVGAAYKLAVRYLKEPSPRKPLPTTTHVGRDPCSDSSMSDRGATSKMPPGAPSPAARRWLAPQILIQLCLAPLDCVLKIHLGWGEPR